MRKFDVNKISKLPIAMICLTRNMENLPTDQAIFDLCLRTKRAISAITATPPPI